MSYIPTVWVDDTPPGLGTLLDAAHLNALEQGVAFASLTYNVKAYGAVGNGVADDTAAITAAIAACEAAGGGVVYFPKGVYRTNGGHNLTRASVLGQGTTVSQVLHRGSTYCFRLKNETSGEQSPSIAHVSIIGSTVSDAAVNNAIGVRVSNGMLARLDHVWVYGFTGTSAIGVQFYNADGTLLYVENTTAIKLAVLNCTTCIHFVTQSGASGVSFGYTNFIALSLQVYANQTAIEIAAGTLYNSKVQGSLHYTGNNGVGFKVASGAAAWQGMRLDIRGEMLGAFTGCKRILNAGSFSALGTFFIGNTGPGDDYSTATLHEFVEEIVPTLEKPQADLASTFTLTVPGGRDAWNVTGTATIGVFAVQTMYEGRRFTLKFAAGATVQHTGGFIHLAGGVNFVATANDTITFAYIGGVAYEVSRSVNA